MNTKEYWELYQLSIKMMRDEFEAPHKKELQVIAARCLQVSSNERNKLVSYPVSLTIKKK